MLNLLMQVIIGLLIKRQQLLATLSQEMKIKKKARKLQVFTILEIVSISFSKKLLIACYMNSAIQCLANTRFFSEYFVKEKKYLKQMNLKSKYGYQGELA